MATSKRVRASDVSTGYQLSKSRILNGDKLHSIVLVANGKLRTGIWSIAISPDSSYLASSRYDGKIDVRDLTKILAESYGPLHVG